MHAFSVAFVNRSFKCRGHRFATKGGLGAASFILSETWRMGRWSRRILLSGGNQGDKSPQMEFYPWSTLNWIRYKLNFSVIHATGLCLRGSRSKWRGISIEDEWGIIQPFH